MFLEYQQILTSFEIDVEKCNFWNFRSSVTLTLTVDRVEVIWCAYLTYPYTKLDQNRKNFVDGRMYGWMDTAEFQSIRSSLLNRGYMCNLLHAIIASEIIVQLF